MAKGFCSECKTPVGGFGKPLGLICPGCGKIYCITCSQTQKEFFGFSQKSYCPNCGRQLLR